jgi:hypothetical protein
VARVQAPSNRDWFDALIDQTVVGTVAGSFTFDTVRLLLSGPPGAPNATFYFDDFSFTPFFLGPPAPPPGSAFQLTVYVTTEGPDLVVTGPNGFSCTGTYTQNGFCKTILAAGTNVVLSTNLELIHPNDFSGCDSHTTTTCTVLMNQNRVVSMAYNGPLSDPPPKPRFFRRRLQ